MRIYDIIWKERFVEKIASKHRVSTDEVAEVLLGRPYIRKAERGRVRGDDLYVAYGRTVAGRYLVVFFIHKLKAMALPISARDMTSAERKYYGQKI